MLIVAITFFGLLILGMPVGFVLGIAGLAGIFDRGGGRFLMMAPDRLFAGLDLIRESNLGVDGASRWEPAHSDAHFHLVCNECGSVQHHPDRVIERMRAHLEADHGFVATTINLVASGTCAACATQVP